MCLANGGELDGARILSRKTCDWMRSNHLPGGADLGAMAGDPSRSGLGFGFGELTIPPILAVHSQVCASDLKPAPWSMQHTIVRSASRV